MRIVCPNCGAQYEVDRALLPSEGREVQCSACGTVWFQNPDAVPPAKPDPVEAGPPAKPDPVEATPPAPEPEATFPADPAAPPAATEEADPPEAPLDDDDTSPGPAAQPRPVSERVRGILREEAEFETQQRAREKGGLETQPELGILGSAPWPSSTPRRKAAPEPVKPSAPPEAEPSPAFPDIEDISASLEPMNRPHRTSGVSAATSAPAKEDTTRPTEGSFLRGLILPLALAALLVALYLLAPVISGWIPGLAPLLLGYVSFVDGLREGIAGFMGL